MEEITLLQALNVPISGTGLEILGDNNELRMIRKFENTPHETVVENLQLPQMMVLLFRIQNLRCISKLTGKELHEVIDEESKLHTQGKA